MVGTDCYRPAESRPDLRPVEGHDAEAELAAFAKAIAHPLRSQILRRLQARTSCICDDIINALPISSPPAT